MTNSTFNETYFIDKKVNNYILKNLLYKEFKLVLHPAVCLFVLLSALLLLPAYPYVIVMMYWIFAVQITFSLALNNKDLQFSSMLPISRKDIVLSKHILQIFFQLLQLIVAIPFALVSALVLNPSGNLVALDPNFAFFAVVLLAFSAFNMCFLPMYFKTGYKLGKPFVLSFVAFFLTMTVCEVAVAVVPFLKQNFDSLSPQTFIYQIPFLIVAIGVYVAVLFYSVKKSINNFEKVSL